MEVPEVRLVERIHDEVDGDSASLAELLALLSSLSQSPLKQSIAVTGAVDQRGNVQAVGGVNEKIEGFFRLCRECGLDGSHGVVLPKSTLSELALKSEVIEAVEQGLFTIWTVDHVDQALAILSLTSSELSELAKDATLDQLATKLKSIKHKVSARLKELSKLAVLSQGGDTTSY